MRILSAGSFLVSRAATETVYSLVSRAWIDQRSTPSYKGHPLAGWPFFLWLMQLSGSLDRLADFVGGAALTCTVVRRDGEIVHLADGQTVHGRGCGVADINGSRIETGCLSYVYFIASDGAGDCVPPESGGRCRGRRG